MSIVRARIRPTALLSGNSWVGLLARSTYPDEYVYVSLRSNNTVTLRRTVSGNVYPIAEVPYTVTPGTWYSVRLEIVARSHEGVRQRQGGHPTNSDYGSIQRYVATQQGAVGVVSYRAAADYDDFLAYQP